LNLLLALTLAIGSWSSLSPAAEAVPSAETSRVETASGHELPPPQAAVVRQTSDYSCGAAALATLLTHDLGDPTTEGAIIGTILEALAPDQAALRQQMGFSLLDLQRAARKRGYAAWGFRLPSAALERLRGPMIVALRPPGREHFAVLRGAHDGLVRLADPARGWVTWARQDFLGAWLGADGTGIVLTVEPATAGRAEGGVMAGPLAAPEQRTREATP